MLAQNPCTSLLPLFNPLVLCLLTRFLTMCINTAVDIPKLVIIVGVWPLCCPGWHTLLCFCSDLLMEVGNLGPNPVMTIILWFQPDLCACLPELSLFLLVISVKMPFYPFSLFFNSQKMPLLFFNFFIVSPFFWCTGPLPGPPPDFEITSKSLRRLRKAKPPISNEFETIRNNSKQFETKTKIRGFMFVISASLEK